MALDQLSTPEMKAAYEAGIILRPGKPAPTVQAVLPT
jgi:hypothetical protein